MKLTTMPRPVADPIGPRACDMLSGMDGFDQVRAPIALVDAAPVIA